MLAFQSQWNMKLRIVLSVAKSALSDAFEGFVIMHIELVALRGWFGILFHCRY